MADGSRSCRTANQLWAADVVGADEQARMECWQRVTGHDNAEIAPPAPAAAAAAGVIVCFDVAADAIVRVDDDDASSAIVPVDAAA